MGLDVIELVMRVEETFSLDLPDDECEQVRTVGDLYRLVLKKLDLTYQPASEIETLPPTFQAKYPPWTTAKVWITLKDIIFDQLQVDGDEIREPASFVDDLGAD
jgi:acyl carrier protein